MKTPTTKKCGKCGEVKSLDEFYKDASAKDGRCTKCKSCEKEYKAQRKAMFQREGYKVITEKNCSACGEVKSIDEFHDHASRKDGKHNQCKSCAKEYCDQRAAKFKRGGYKVIAEKKCCMCGQFRHKDHFNKDASKSDGKQTKCKACEKELKAQRKAKLKRDGYEAITEKKCNTCGEVKGADEFGKSASAKDGKQSQCKACSGAYRAQPHVKARINERQRERYKNDPQYKIACILRDALRRVLKGEAKTESALVLVGCTTEKLWEHLENSFVDGMTVQNHGEVWHVGHIECLSGFDGTNAEHVKRVNHFSNLKAQFKEENLSDGAHVPDNHQAGLPLWYD